MRRITLHGGVPEREVDWWRSAAEDPGRPEHPRNVGYFQHSTRIVNAAAFAATSSGASDSSDGAVA